MSTSYYAVSMESTSFPRSLNSSAVKSSASKASRFLDLDSASGTGVLRVMSFSSNVYQVVSSIGYSMRVAPTFHWVVILNLIWYVDSTFKNVLSNLNDFSW